MLGLFYNYWQGAVTSLWRWRQ